MGSAKLYIASSAENPAIRVPTVNGFSFVQRRLIALQRLDASDLAKIQAMEATAHHYSSGVDIAAEGDAPGRLHIQADGWAFRYRLLEDGRRQIFDFVLPGDWYDLNTLSGQPYKSSIGTITPSLTIPVPTDFVSSCSDTHPRLFDAIEVMRCEANARLEETLTMLGRLTATESMRKFLWRTFQRLDAVGLVEGNSAVFPLTQELVGDHLGLSTVHVNRTMRVLKNEWDICVANGLLTIADVAALQSEHEAAAPQRLAC